MRMCKTKEEEKITLASGVEHEPNDRTINPSIDRLANKNPNQSTEQLLITRIFRRSIDWRTGKRHVSWPRFRPSPRRGQCSASAGMERVPAHSVAVPSRMPHYNPRAPPPPCESPAARCPDVDRPAPVRIRGRRWWPDFGRNPAAPSTTLPTKNRQTPFPLTKRGQTLQCIK